MPPVKLAVFTIVVNIPLLAVTLAAADINPLVRKLPPVTLPVALNATGTLTCPVPFAFSVIFPLALVLIHNSPASTILPDKLKLLAEVIEPVADINPPVRMLPPTILPVAETAPVATLLPTLTPFADEVIF